MIQIGCNGHNFMNLDLVVSFLERAADIMLVSTFFVDVVECDTYPNLVGKSVKLEIHKGFANSFAKMELEHSVWSWQVIALTPCEDPECILVKGPHTTWKFKVCLIER